MTAVDLGTPGVAMRTKLSSTRGTPLQGHQVIKNAIFRRHVQICTSRMSPSFY